MKLQQAYISEAGDTYGSWTKIGYVMQSNTNFTYADPKWGTEVNSATIASTNNELVWQATNKANLNSCAKDKNWKVAISATSDALGPVKYTTSTDDDGNCLILNPSFERIGK